MRAFERAVKQPDKCAEKALSASRRGTRSCGWRPFRTDSGSALAWQAMHLSERLLRRIRRRQEISEPSTRFGHAAQAVPLSNRGKKM